ncbi:family 43 glycosylhydrolase [Wenyingzhuangia sp. IMCC45574]
MRDFKLVTLGVLLVSLFSCKNEKQNKVAANENVKHEIVSTDVIVPEHGMADPHAWVEKDTLYIICGHDESWEGKGSFRMDRWEVWSTPDLKNWTHRRNILPSQTYIGDQPNCWAGDVCERNGKYYWFFSNRYIDTGVMEADEITGEYKDILGKPLLPADIIPENPYDPEIYIENDVYTICFGAGTYYMATLAEDMKSLTTEPKPIKIYNPDGSIIRTEDKPTLFKRNDWYYLVFGSRYCMSKNLYGPYDFKGAFLEGGHTSFFEWHDQLYVLQENHDISAFYRGASLKPVFFNEDATVKIPSTDRMYPSPGRPFKFINSTMGWKGARGTDLSFKDGVISGTVTEKGAMVTSAPWLYTKTEPCSKIEIKIKNNSKATELKIALFTRTKGKNFWSNTTPPNWDKLQWVTIPITANEQEFKVYTVDLSEFKNLNKRLMQVAIQPAANAKTGTWSIDEVIVK